MREFIHIGIAGRHSVSYPDPFP